MISALERHALTVAVVAHRGQVDKAGKPYSNHPRRVAERLGDEADPEALAVAWLHDVVEDTTWTLDLLTAIGWFPPSVVEAVDAITHRPKEQRASYYRRVKANPLALIVKLADIADNSDPERLAMLDDATADRLRAKYATALDALGRV